MDDSGYSLVSAWVDAEPLQHTVDLVSRYLSTRSHQTLVAGVEGARRWIRTASLGDHDIKPCEIWRFSFSNKVQSLLLAEDLNSHIEG